MIFEKYKLLAIVKLADCKAPVLFFRFHLMILTYVCIL